MIDCPTLKDITIISYINGTGPSESNSGRAVYMQCAKPLYADYLIM